MLFNSAEFLRFIAVVYPIYLVLAYSNTARQKSFRNLFLLAASYCFYAAWDYRFLNLIIISTLVDFLVARAIERQRSENAKFGFLALSIVTNLSLLGFFKYYNFFVESFASLLTYFGMSAHLPTLEIALPVGISFYTFQTLGYTIDVYRGDIRASANVLNFALYVAFFPQLVAGPIEKAQHLLPQLDNPARIDSQKVWTGLYWILLGYFQKCVIADTMAPIVDYSFAHPDKLSGIISLIGVVAFALQIFGDFSGYTFIARGIALLMGIELMRNFRAPYFATCPSDFWKRWHISLSQWLRDYLYISLGGNRRGKVLSYRNLLITMVLGGLWHGAAWNFVLWGLYHGLALVLTHRSFRFLRLEWRFFFVVKIFATFLFTLFGWLLFRVHSLQQLNNILLNIFYNFSYSPNLSMYLIPTLICFCVIFLMHYLDEHFGDDAIVKISSKPIRLGILIFFALSVFGVGFQAEPFLYFQF